METKVYTPKENSQAKIKKLKELSTINRQKIEDIDLKLQKLESDKDIEKTESRESFI